tara:strand:+ start:3794 stop:4009 length:216 start_codon:yes stop_codon:yes gene_type:complete
MIRSEFLEYFFAPTQIIVVSEERLKRKEIELKERQLQVVENRLAELTEYKKSIQGELKALSPNKDEATCDV